MIFAPVDWIFFIIILCFSIFAAIKGFVREIFNKLSWILGIVGSFCFAKYLEPFFLSFIKSEILSYIVSYIVTFIIIFMLVQVIKVIISKFFNGELMSGLDRALGFVFGLLEGFAVVLVILYIIDVQTIKPASEFMANSLFYKYLIPFIKSAPVLVQPKVMNNV